MGSFGIFPSWGLLGAPGAPAPPESMVARRVGGLGELGERVLKAGGIEMWSLGNGLWTRGLGVTSGERIHHLQVGRRSGGVPSKFRGCPQNLVSAFNSAGGKANQRPRFVESVKA